MSYKDEIQERADELAFERYDKDFYDLTEEQRDKVYEYDQNSWTNHYASLADSMAEERKFEEEPMDTREEDAREDEQLRMSMD